MGVSTVDISINSNDDGTGYDEYFSLGLIYRLYVDRISFGNYVQYNSIYQVVFLDGRQFDLYILKLRRRIGIQK